MNTEGIDVAFYCSAKEAATRIPKEVQEVYPEISWRLIIATRNRLNMGIWV